VTTNTHNHVEVGFVLIRAFDEPGLLDVLPKNTILGRSHDFASDKFRKAMRYRVGGKHGSLLAHHYDGEPQEQAQAPLIVGKLVSGGARDRHVDSGIDADGGQFNLTD
jgi:hypothetical protein